MIAARQATPECQHLGERSLDLCGPRAGELEEIGVPLVRHDARTGRELRGQHQPAKFLRTVEDHVGRELGEIVPQLGAPEEDGGLELAAPVLHRGDAGVEAAESERTPDPLPVVRQRRAVACRAPERRPVDPPVDRIERLDRIEHSFRVRQCPEPRRRRHRPSLVSVSGPDDRAMARSEPGERIGGVERLRLEPEHGITQVEPEIGGDLVVAGTPGVDAESDVTEATGKPEFDRRVDVLVLGADGEAASGVRREGGAERLHPFAALARADTESPQVPEAAEDVPADQAGVELAVIGHGVGQHLGIDRSASAPKGGWADGRMGGARGRHPRYSLTKRA